MAQRHELESKLKGETLVRKELLAQHEALPVLRVMPELNVVKIGGHGLVDYGKDVVLPLMEEIGELSREHQLLVVTGGGVRVRHVLDIGIDLGMPTGVLAELAAKISEQNAVMLTLLLSRWGGTRVHTSDLLELPTTLKLGLLPVVHGTPPYGLYEHPPEVGRIPPHRTDTGALLIAELLGARSCILLKDVDGLYTEDPKKNPRATLIDEISCDELVARDLPDLVLEPKVLDILRAAKNVREVRIVNGHEPGCLTRAIRGEKVGTVVRK